MVHNPKTKVFTFSKEMRCPTCHGDGQKWIQLSTLEGAGYVPCSTCNGEGWLNSDIFEISEKEIIVAYEKIKISNL